MNPAPFRGQASPSGLLICEGLRAPSLNASHAFLRATRHHFDRDNMAFPGMGGGMGMGGGRGAGLDAEQMQQQQMIKYV